MEAKSMKKYGVYTVLAAITIQLTVGIAYIWSVFQNGVAASIFNGDNAAASRTFAILLLSMTLASVLGGKLAVRYSTKLIVFIGGVMIAAGFFFASFATAEYPWVLWLTYGALGGAGMGFTYTPAIATAQKWYPHKKGMITGIIVAALGLGTVVFAPVAEWLIERFGGEGVGEAKTFMILSAAFLIVCSAGSLFMRNPPEGYTVGQTPAAAAANKQGEDKTTSEMLRTPQFYLVFVSMLLACMGGQMMIGFAKPIAVARDFGDIAKFAVMVIALTNAAGRLVWGMVSDKLGRINTLIVLLAGSAVMSLLVNAAGGYLVFGVIALIGLFYGGFLSNFPSLTADLFGAKSQGSNYGCVLVSFGIGAIVSQEIAGYYKNVADQARDAAIANGVNAAQAANDSIALMFPAFIIASCCAAAGVILMIVLKVTSKRAKAGKG